ncbi:hypothetical protein [Primorskyibacter sp. S187A]|uniref:hypothetical protein n=1 Tax=Primorskyibacter sp. S187A TaxID=3415130 RepID=UPI003C7B0724
MHGQTLIEGPNWNLPNPENRARVNVLYDEPSTARVLTSGNRPVHEACQTLATGQLNSRRKTDRSTGCSPSLREALGEQPIPGFGDLASGPDQRAQDG